MATTNRTKKPLRNTEMHCDIRSRTPSGKVQGLPK